MRNIAFLFIWGIAAFIAWSWFQPVCPGGAVVRDEAACRAAPGFDAAFCRGIFARTAKIASENGPAFASQSECTDRWPVCEPHGPGNMQWGARPAAWCLARSPERIEPQYDRRG